MADSDDIQLVYDRQCPVCDYYCQKVEVRESAGTLQRIDARERSAIMDEITALGLDIDEGMIVKVGDKLHYGSDAIHELALLSSRRGFFNRFSYEVFRSPVLARMVYPALKACRNLLLKILGRSRINNLGLPGHDRF